MDRKKVVNISLILVSVLLYLVASQAVELLFDVLKWPVNRDFVLTFPEMISGALAIVVFVAISRNVTFSSYLNDAVNELQKVTYPTPKESSQSAVIVVGLVALAAFVLTVFDSIWAFVTRWVLTS
jgi:preprotein translocase SecE subunit